MLVFCVGCTASKTAQTSVIDESNRDIVAISYLIRDYMQQTDNTNFTLADIAKYDTIGQVTNNFSKLEVGNWPNLWRGGYAVFFKFSDTRNKESVNLSAYRSVPRKVKTKEKIGRKNAQNATEFDGEIHFHYPERHYHVAEIILKKPK
jgi:hypothetical protein